MNALRLGFGVSGPLGQVWFSERKTRALIHQAVAAGVRHFDTAPFYHEAEQRLGAALGGLSDDVFISTKTGTRRRGSRLFKDFSETAIRADVEQSLRRLGRSRIDLLYLHGPSPAEIETARPIIESLKREGAIASAGVCGEGAALACAVDAGFDAVMGVYNLLDRRHESVFAAARRRGLLTVAVAPLAQGLFDPTLFTPASAADLWRTARFLLRGRYRRGDLRGFSSLFRSHPEVPPAAAALGFVLANPAVDVVMTTTSKSAHLAQSLAIAEAGLDPAFVGRLRALAK
jgi:aryl-alcohol dehydrogenase-like predicted oxidoreductase